MIEHKFPLSPAASDLAPWLAGEDVSGIIPLPGWHNSIFRVETRSSDRFVLRVHVPSEDAALVEPTLRVAAAYSKRLAFVNAPAPTLAGALFSSIDGRVAELWPYVVGEPGSKDLLHGTAGPAECLAALQQAGSVVLDEVSDLQPEYWRDMDWRANRRWSVGSVKAFLLSGNPNVPVDLRPERLADELEAATWQVKDELRQVDAARMPVIPIHGDFYPSNLVIDAGGVIAALVDWDDARIDWRAWDVANALLEFCGGPAGMHLDRACCRNFLEELWSAGGELNSSEIDALPLLVRARKLDELMYGLQEAADFANGDRDYLRSSISGWGQIRELKYL